MSREKNVGVMAEELVRELVTQKMDSIDFDKKANDIFAKNFKKSVVKLITIDFEVNGKKVERNVHKDFQTVLKLISTGEPVFLYGPAGSGKTHTAVQAAYALGLEHFSISVNEQTTKTDFLGYFDANSNLIKTNFRKAYENGGMYIIDEIDAANPNVLTVLNSALSNGFMAFPDGNVTRHEKFLCVCTANTTGEENSVQYIGRNILDAATLDRFIRWYFDYDTELENKMLSKEIQKLRDLIRKFISDKKLNDFISTRTLKQIQKLTDVGFDLRESLLLAMKPSQDILNLADKVKVKIEEAQNEPVGEPVEVPF
jgi:MoxR-like ATPase